MFVLGNYLCLWWVMLPYLWIMFWPFHDKNLKKLEKSVKRCFLPNWQRINMMFIFKQRNDNRVNDAQSVILCLTVTVLSVISPLIELSIHLALITPSMFPGTRWTADGALWGLFPTQALLTLFSSFGEKGFQQTQVQQTIYVHRNKQMRTHSHKLTSVELKH